MTMKKNSNCPSTEPGFVLRRLTPSIVAVSVLFALAACGKTDTSTSGGAGKPASEAKAEQPEEGLKLSEEEIKRAGLRVVPLEMQDVAETLAVTATIRPNQDRIARVVPRVEGRLVSVSANLGQSVNARQPLATLDSIALGEAHYAWMQAQTAQRAAQADFKRAEALNADEIISQKDFLRTKAELEKASAELHAAEGKLRLLGASIKQGETNTASIFSVVAPFAGTVIEKKATVGELANSSDALFTVADLSTLWIEANLTEAMLPKVRTGSKASVSVTAYPGEKFTGRVTYIANVLDKETRTIAARIEIANKDGRLKPEMFATAMIETGGNANQALLVPDEAIVLLQGLPTVFVAEHGSFTPKAIEPGDKLGGRTIVKSGLAAGDQVVVAGTYALKARLLKSQIGDAH